MKHFALSATLVALVLVGFTAARAEDDKPAGSRWMLGFEHGPLKIIPVQSVTGQDVTYHYMTMKVTNPTQHPRSWYPRVSAITDTGKVRRALAYADALEAIREVEKNPDLMPVGSTMGKIQPGETLDTVAIFGPLDPLYDQVRVQVIGLADPIAIYKVERIDVPIEVDGVVYTQTDAESMQADVVKEGIVIQDVAYVARNKAVRDELTKELGGAELPQARVEYWEVKERRAYEMVYERLGDEFRADDDLITHEAEYWTIVGDVRLERQIRM